MQMRVDDYHAKLHRFLFVEMPLIAALIGAVVFAVAYGVRAAFPNEAAPAAFSWWQAALAWWLLILVLPLLMLRPKRPSERDVLADIALRRQVGMDDSVER